jgi:hypothetical protein
VAPSSGTAELVEALALDHDARGRAVEGLHVGRRQAHVLQAQGLERLEAEHVADDRRRQVGDGARLEEIEVVGDVGEKLVFAAGHRVDAVGLGAVALAGRQAIGPDHGPGRRGRLTGHGGRGLDGIDAVLRRDAEQRDHIGVDRLVVGLPVAHLRVLHDAGAVAVGLVLAAGVVHSSNPLYGLKTCTQGRV